MYGCPATQRGLERIPCWRHLVYSSMPRRYIRVELDKAEFEQGRGSPGLKCSGALGMFSRPRQAGMECLFQETERLSMLCREGVWVSFGDMYRRREVLNSC